MKSGGGGQARNDIPWRKFKNQAKSARGLCDFI